MLQLGRALVKCSRNRPTQPGKIIFRKITKSETKYSEICCESKNFFRFTKDQNKKREHFLNFAQIESLKVPKMGRKYFGEETF